MSWSEILATDSLATSYATISGNFGAIEGVLGSLTLSNGITKAQGDILYASDANTLSKLAKSSTSSILTNLGTNNNPSWADMGGGLPAITKLTGLTSATSLVGVGTIKTGTWQGTAVAKGYGGIGTNAIDSGNSAISGTSGSISFNFTFSSAPTVVPNCLGPVAISQPLYITAVTTTGFSWYKGQGDATAIHWVAIGTPA